MIGRKGMFIVILFLLTLGNALQAQQAPASKEEALRRFGVSSPPQTADSSQPASFYRLDFAVREMDGEKLIDTRHYSLWVQSGVSQNMTAGSEVPYPGAVFSPPTGSGSTKSIQYRSVGVSIECIISTKEGDDSPRLVLTLNISDALPPEKGTDSPAFRKVTLNARAMLNLGKPTIVGSVEDPGSRHRFQVDVTATKLK